MHFLDEINMKKNKNGLAHLEIIIAFMLFASFVFFILFFIKIPSYNGNLESSLNLMRYSLEDYSKVNLTKLTLKTNSNSDFSVNLSNLSLSTSVQSVVRTTDLNIVPSYFDNSNKILHIDSNNNFFLIYLSENFTNVALSFLPPLPYVNYSIGSVEKIDVLFYGNLLNLKTRYDSGENMNPILKIPENLGFAIRSDITGLFLNNNIPQDVAIEAKTNIYKILYSSGDIETKQITFELWK